MERIVYPRHATYRYRPAAGVLALTFPSLMNSVLVRSTHIPQTHPQLSSYPVDKQTNGNQNSTRCPPVAGNIYTVSQLK